MEMRERTLPLRRAVEREPTGGADRAGGAGTRGDETSVSGSWLRTATAEMPVIRPRDDADAAAGAERDFGGTAEPPGMSYRDDGDGAVPAERDSTWTAEPPLMSYRDEEGGAFLAERPAAGTDPWRGNGMWAAELAQRHGAGTALLPVFRGREFEPETAGGNGSPTGTAELPGLYGTVGDEPSDCADGYVTDAAESLWEPDVGTEAVDEAEWEAVDTLPPAGRRDWEEVTGRRGGRSAAGGGRAGGGEAAEGAVEPAVGGIRWRRRTGRSTVAVWAVAGILAGLGGSLVAARLLRPTEAESGWTVVTPPRSAVRPSAGIGAVEPIPEPGEPVLDAAAEEAAAALAGVAPAHEAEGTAPQMEAAAPPGDVRPAVRPRPPGKAARGAQVAEARKEGERRSGLGRGGNGEESAEAPRAPRKGARPVDPGVEAVVSAWRAGAFAQAAELGTQAESLEARRLATLVGRFGRAYHRARRTSGLAAVPILEEALGLAEEIGIPSAAAAEVRRNLAALHRTAARRAEEQGDLEGALVHLEQAAELDGGDEATRRLRRGLASRAKALYLEGYSLQELDPPAALERFDLAVRLAGRKDPWGAKAAERAARLRAGPASSNLPEWPDT